MKKFFFISLLMVQPLLYAADVNVYSARKEALIKPLFDQFSQETGITVNLITGKADTLLKRLEVEGQHSPADILLTVDAARLARGKNKGLLQTIHSPLLEKIVPAHYRDVDNQWFGLSLRSRVIVYAPERVNASDLNNYIDLAKPQWKNRICVRSSANVYNQSLVAAMIANHGLAKARLWVEGLVHNFARAPKGGDRDQIKAVAAGVCDVALVNNYYLAGMLDSSQQRERDAATAVKLFWPSQNDTGAHINISGMALLKSAKNPQAAIQLMEFMLSEQAQLWYADNNYEYPIDPSIKSNSALLKNWGDFKADQLNINLLGQYNADAVMLMDRASWQ